MTCALALCLLAGHLSITDGDTLRAGDLRVRLWGVDAPELSMATGPTSRSALIGIIGDRDLACDPLYLDRYHRTVARCQIDGGPQDGADIACLLVTGGWAKDWPKYSKGYYAGCAR